MADAPYPDWLRALRDAGWVLLVLALLALAYLLVTGWGSA